MPKLSPTMDEGQIARWLKNEGDVVEFGEVMAEVDTDKATMEMTAMQSGVLLKVLAPAGSVVALGAPIGIIGEAGEDISALLATDSKQPASSTAQSAGAVSSQQEQSAPALAPAPASNGRIMVSPVAARMASEKG